MATEYLLSNSGRPLNGENFNAWIVRMTSTLTALGLKDYIMQNCFDVNIPEDQKNQVIKENSLAKSIIYNNIEDNIFPLIPESESAYELIENLKAMYEKDKEVSLQEWMNKLKDLKVKSYRDLLTVMSRMMAIFKKMEIAKVPLSENEKIDYMLGAMTNEQKLIFISSSTTSSEDLFKDIKTKCKLLYHVGRNISRSNTESNDKMDIDLIDNILNMNKDINKYKSNKFCHICNKSNHNTNECYFNGKNKIKDKDKIKTDNRYKKSNNKQKYKNKNYKNHKNSYYISKENNDFIYSDSEKEMFNNLYINNVNYDNKNNNNKITTWIYDTGASEHITNNKNILTNFTQKPITMKCANNSTCEFSGYGTYFGKINNKNIKLDKVYYSENISKNLISGIKLSQSNITCEISKYLNKPQLTLTYKNDIILKTYAKKHNNFIIKTKNILENKKIFNLEKTQDFKNLWHNRLGHYYNENIEKYLNDHQITKEECIDCKIAKLPRKPHNGITPKSTKINEIIHSDIMGPISDSINKYKYIITFIDDYSRKSWIYLLKNKTDATNTVINFIKFINNQHPNNRIQILKSDNAKEYNNKKIKNFCKRNGINKIFSPPYNPQNNGVAERFNRTITACAKTILYCAGLSLNFWEFAIKHATYIYNLIPHKSIKNRIPNEIYFNKKVNLKFLKTFGCLAYYKNFNQNKQKFDINSKKGIYLGYDNNTHSFIIMDYYDYSIHYTREAVFLEDKPGNLKIDTGNVSGNTSFSKIKISNGPVVSDNDHISNSDEIDSSYNPISEFPNDQEVHHEFDSSDFPISKIPDDHEECLEFEPDSGNHMQVNYSENISHSIQNINNLDSNNNQNNINTKHFISNKRPISPQFDTQAKKHRIINNQKINYNFYDNFETKSPNICDNSDLIPYKHVEIIKNDDGLYVPKIFIIDTDVPICYNHIFNRDDKIKWIEAIKNELNNLYNNKVMQFVSTIPDGTNVIATKWVFALKRNKFNEIIKYKARLVARGDKQIYGLDYDIVYSPTLDIACIRIILFLAAKFKWETYQLDIQAAYLNAPLDKEVYVKIPKGDKNYGKGFWKLKKSLYGLKQSGKNWNETISKFLIKINFKQCKNEPCLFYLTDISNTVICIIGLFVDDMIISGFFHNIYNIIQKIKLNYSISNCQPINFFLGISIEKNNEYLYTISQKAFIENLLNRYNINNFRKSNTPCTGENTISKNTNPFDITTYKSAIGSLIHLAKCSRPDIAFAVNYAARFCEHPTISDWNKIINILKYLNNTINYKISFNGLGKITAYSDADFGGDKSDRKSTSGMIICFGNNPIYWASQKQKSIALSTAEAEFISASSCSRKILWIQNLLNEIFDKHFLTTLFIDNQSCKKVIENGQFNSNMKHIDIREHFIFNLVKENKIKLEYIETENMLADIFTKNVNGPKMTKFTNIIFKK